jgi:single-strand DNA-binding protein
MPNLNKVLIMGHLGNDPEVKVAQGFTIVNFTVATSDSYKDKKSGQWVKNTEWHKIVMFGTQAESAGNLLKKGMGVFIEGKIKNEKFTDKNNVEKNITKIIASNWQLLTQKDKVSTEKTSNSQVSEDDYNHDVPF